MAIRRECKQADWVSGIRGLCQAAAVGADRPHLKPTAPIGSKHQAFAVGKPSDVVVAVIVLGQLAQTGSVRPHDSTNLAARRASTG